MQFRDTPTGGFEVQWHIHWSKNKGLRWCLTQDQVAQLQLSVEEVRLWDGRPALVPIKPRRRARTQSCHATSLHSQALVVQYHLCSYMALNQRCASACAAAEESPRWHLRPLLSFPVFFEFLKRWTFFQTIQSLDWIFPGLCRYPPISNPLSPGFSPSLYGSHFCSYCTLVKVCHPGFYCTCLIRGISPSLFIPPLLIWGSGSAPVVPWEDWKADLSCLLRNEPVWWKMWLFPSVFVKLTLPRHSA